jgi:hypothetical protein
LIVRDIDGSGILSAGASAKDEYLLKVRFHVENAMDDELRLCRRRRVLEIEAGHG